MNDKEIIYDLVKEVREDQRDIKKDICEIKEVLNVNTLSLQEHMRRTDALESLYHSHQNRIVKLEEPIKFKELLVKKYLKIATLITTTLGILTAWAKYKGFF